MRRDVRQRPTIERKPRHRLERLRPDLWDRPREDVVAEDQEVADLEAEMARTVPRRVMDANAIQEIAIVEESGDLCARRPLRGEAER